MIRLSQIRMFLMIAWSPLLAVAEIDSAMLIAEWCLVIQTMNGHASAVILPKGTLSENSWPSQVNDIIVLMQKRLGDDGGYNKANVYL